MDHQLAASFWQQMWQGLGSKSAPQPLPTFIDTATFSSAFAVSELAATSIGLATQAAARLIHSPHLVEINVRLASRWFQHSFMTLNRPAPILWDAFAGDYASADGWIRLHTNAASHRQAMKNVLGQHTRREALAKQVAQWRATELEQAIIDAGGCAAEMRSTDVWQQHPQGRAVNQEPLIDWQVTASGPVPAWMLPAARPLLGVNVLDLTRVIAGPVATRFLASLGANVLRIDPPGWQEPVLDEEITCGKRRTVLDLKTNAGREQFRQLLRKADVLVHGYRADALEKLGFDAETRQLLAPGLVDVGLNAWGWQGPWRNHRGFDSLVQMGCGIAEHGKRWKNSDQPTPLPVQALDHATGYLMAAAVLEGLRQRKEAGNGCQARLSLARTALLLQQHGYPAGSQQTGITPDTKDNLAMFELTPWGFGVRLRSAAYLPGTALVCATPGCLPGTHPPGW
ncbi:CoA transferase [Mixta mediterraneensis]|uniref:CoA transferase n=1 Tax=Mixta mediterraneensis TaxID=2758443 RepID=UPI001876B489|nr:CoA transferase [Mixta mediterraneensis]MBE5252871.1 CoA transferase [Mixta mediterraneensis]